ncbi:hypothetical protein QBC35DRAFT_252325 [Podospora australis]|uniref:Uncharacterized protein n=1 Tax=Podospora australis TaxID=1536484 RepID=A0AAN7AI58_9PEZI|nr:hypothetical protein QBC35DRAFT_252325 [Podospora australis]
MWVGMDHMDRIRQDRELLRGLPLKSFTELCLQDFRILVDQRFPKDVGKKRRLQPFIMWLYDRLVDSDVSDAAAVEGEIKQWYQFLQLCGHQDEIIHGAFNDWQQAQISQNPLLARRLGIMELHLQQVMMASTSLSSSASVPSSSATMAPRGAEARHQHMHPDRMRISQHPTPRSELEYRETANPAYGHMHPDRMRISRDDTQVFELYDEEDEPVLTSINKIVFKGGQKSAPGTKPLVPTGANSMVVDMPTNSCQALRSKAITHDSSQSQRTTTHIDLTADSPSPEGKPAERRPEDSYNPPTDLPGGLQEALPVYRRGTIHGLSDHYDDWQSRFVLHPERQARLSHQVEEGLQPPLNYNDSDADDHKLRHRTSQKHTRRSRSPEMDDRSRGRSFRNVKDIITGHRRLGRSRSPEMSDRFQSRVSRNDDYITVDQDRFRRSRSPEMRDRPHRRDSRNDDLIMVPSSRHTGRLSYHDAQAAPSPARIPLAERITNPMHQQRMDADMNDASPKEHGSNSKMEKSKRDWHLRHQPDEQKSLDELIREHSEQTSLVQHSIEDVPDREPSPPIVLGLTPKKFDESLRLPPKVLELFKGKEPVWINKIKHGRAMDFFEAPKVVVDDSLQSTWNEKLNDPDGVTTTAAVPEKAAPKATPDYGKIHAKYIRELNKAERERFTDPLYDGGFFYSSDEETTDDDDDDDQQEHSLEENSLGDEAAGEGSSFTIGGTAMDHDSDSEIMILGGEYSPKRD